MNPYPSLSHKQASLKPQTRPSLPTSPSPSPSQSSRRPRRRRRRRRHGAEPPLSSGVYERCCGCERGVSSRPPPPSFFPRSSRNEDFKLPGSRGPSWSAAVIAAKGKLLRRGGQRTADGNARCGVDSDADRGGRPDGWTWAGRGGRVSGGE